MDIHLFPIGSAGDVFPFIGLGERLQRRGHAVTLATAEAFRDDAEKVGLNFVALSNQHEFDEVMENPRLWHPLHGPRVVFRDSVLPMLRRQFEYVEGLPRSEGTLLVASTLGFGVRIARDKWELPLASLHLQPVVIWSEHASPQLGPLWLDDGVPRWAKRLQFRLTVKAMLNPPLRGPVNALRSENGLPPVRNVNELWHSPDLVVGMFPEWFAPPQPDWPVQAVLTSFPLWNAGGEEPLDADLDRFLGDGEPPLVFTAGSAMLHAEDFFQTAVEVCRRLDRRGLLVAREGPQVPRNLPANVKHAAYAPFSHVFPRSALVVHHGGVGTLSQTLAAGVPQIIMPLSHDQPDNGKRIQRLGVGDVIPRRQFQVDRAARAVRYLLTNPDVQVQCQHWAARLRELDGLEATCDALEQLADKSDLVRRPASAGS